MSTFFKLLGVAALVVVAFLVGAGTGYDAGYDDGLRASTDPGGERCQQLAALIPPINAEMDRVLASPTAGVLDRMTLQNRRSAIQLEMREAGCR